MDWRRVWCNQVVKPGMKVWRPLALRCRHQTAIHSLWSQSHRALIIHCMCDSLLEPIWPLSHHSPSCKWHRGSHSQAELRGVAVSSLEESKA
ncbi:hypothetical protein F2P79_010947 [Pimephales promelas]|nr:hypothetical protein F2P79_010947 [Pimephales promelas]